MGASVLSEKFPVQICLTLTKVTNATIDSELRAFLPDPLGLVYHFPLSQQVPRSNFFQCYFGEFGESDFLGQHLFKEDKYVC